MIREIATLKIDPAKASEFEAAVREATPLFREAEGCGGMALDRVIEEPGTYLLRVRWKTVADHMETFRNSDAFAIWRDLAGPFFVEPPVVVHVEHEKFF